MSEKKSKKFLALALIFLVSVVAVFSAAMLLKKGDIEGGKTSNGMLENISQILDSKEAVLVAKNDSKLVDFNKEVQEVSDAFDKIKAEDFKSDEAKAKFDEAEASFVKLKESGELAGLILEMSGEGGMTSEKIEMLKQNEELKSLGEAFGEYKAKLDEYKTKYAGNGEDFQAVLDYSALEAQGELVKSELTELRLAEVTTDEIETFYAKIEELKEIISNS